MLKNKIVLYQQNAVDSCVEKKLISYFGQHER